MVNPAAIPRHVEPLRKLLFAEEDLSTYAVLDGASVPGLLEKIQSAPEEWGCLYRGELEPDLAEVAPYLIKLRRESPLTDWILEEGWGRHWGIFAVTPVGLEALRRHLRHFLRVKAPDGRLLYFRYYDPRVLRAYLPTCNRAEIKFIYGPVNRFIAEEDRSRDAVVLPFDARRIKGTTAKLI
jgi:hypothetical protein